MTLFRRRLRARLGVRATTALAAAASVAVVLVLAGAALVFLLDRSMRASLENTASLQTTQLGQRVAANFQGELKQNAVDATGKRTDLVQVVTDYSARDDPGGDIQIIGSSDVLGDRPRMSELMPAPGETEVVPARTIELSDGMRVEALIVVQGFDTKYRPIVVLAAQRLDPVHRAVDTVFVMVLIGVPILVLVTGWITYLFAGRALRPVEAMRTQVADMTDRDLGRRVPVPPAHDEVARLAETMNAMLARLENAQGIQRRFVADASHELRSPLATIATGLELMAGPGGIDPATVGTLRGETERLNRLVDGLLLLARADERGLQPRREEVDLDEVVQAERTRPSEVGGVAPQVRAEPVRMVGDRGQLLRVVRNLVDNARRHARSRVLVTVTRSGQDAVIEVTDDGPGVPVAERARIFERFVRLDVARARSDGGAGLGLAIVAEVVAAHGGDVGVEDAPGGGALFRVRLPAIPESDRVPADAETVGVPWARAQPGSIMR
ncbi:sensor histidine kinase [Pseudonocardia asaccharolytica]|uniref:histidine kinase n=1 Tax=Pseudonocardia asaccharolytica DSM 44247 = NBRC 16224 TaxID=1123024 RepID=A0A511D1R7_9PSEU|nr:HAMP domain-containing sensor histidine kinase [Pseudonocardia asaccharolytica]GEL17484.1 two-component sensor histidine kinase [Pseudonocardia asaccharolytica DSM 44247 = NBRC 16224]